MTTAAPPVDAPPIPSNDELIARARALKPVLRERARQVEESGSIPPETIDDLREAGFFRFNSPRERGGYAVNGRTRTEVLSILAEGCASTAWVVGVYSGGVTSVAHSSPQLQDEVFADGPDVMICGNGTPTDDVEKVDGGYLVTGRWYSVSGSAHAGWVSLFLALPPVDGGMPGMAKALVPLSDVTIEKTWDAAGMRGTESETVVADRLFVPDHRVDVMTGPPPADPVLAVGPCAIPVGIAQGALERAIEYAAKKPLSGTIYAPAATSATFQIELADAAMHIQTARLHLMRATELLDAADESGERLDLATRAQCRGDAGWIMRNITQAIDIIMTAIGAGAFAESSPFERAWRDVSTTARHGAVNYIINREIYGKVLLGQDGNISRLAV
ncbi:acyl-CoA dehydrogenase family protein [Okibacterium endophyticum]